MSEMHDPYEDQLAAARYKAERDQARQELARLRGEATTMSAYDLLPDEEREALRWVREHGGLDSVKKLLDWVVGHCSTKQQLDFDFWLSGRVMYELGFDEDVADRDEVERRLLARLLPWGMEWPRFEDNEPVAFGDYAEIGDCIGPIVSVTIRSADNTSLEKPAYDIAVLRSGFVNHSPIEPFSVRVKRPAVLAADGKPLRDGETVWSVYSGTRYTVEKITDGLIPIKCRSEMGSTVSLHPSQLTHTNPEPPDTYAKLYEDVHDERCGSEEFVLRCRALAERGE